MTIGKNLKQALKGDFKIDKKSIELSSGEALRFTRELHNMSQNELADLTGIPQSTVSGIENGRIKLGAERAKVFARTLKIHPAVLLFPSWDTEKESAA